METCFLASPDALEVIVVTHSLTHLLTYWLSVSTDLTDVTLAIEDTDKDDQADEDDEDDEEDLTDVTLVSDDTYWRLDWSYSRAIIFHH